MIILTFATTGRCEDWRGWRGLDQQGTRNTPLTFDSWSTNEHVLWSVPIPGVGHSSPVIQGGHVYVTAAQETAQNSLKSVTTGISLTAIAFLVVAGLASHRGLRVHRRTDPASRWTTGRAIPWGMLLGCIASLTFLAYRSLRPTNQDHESGLARWLVGANVLAACVVASTYGLRGRSWWRGVCGIGLIGLAIGVAVGRPNPEYYGAVDGATSMMGALRWGIALPGTFGLVMLLGWLPRRLFGHNAESAESAQHVVRGDRWPILIPLLACVAGIALPVVIFKIPALLDAALGLMQGVRGGPIRFLAMSYSALVVILISWAIVDVIGAPNGSLPVPGWLRVSLILFGAWLAIDMNGIRKDSHCERIILGFNRQTGEREWIARGLPGPLPALHKSNSAASPTPVVDGNAIYAYFGDAGAMATSLDGKVIWSQRDLPFVGIHGAAASPMPLDGRLIVLCDMASAPYLTALDLRTGARTWTARRTPWQGQHGRHCTPVVTRLDGNPLIIVWGSTDLDVYRPTDGGQSAHLKVACEPASVRVASPLIDGDRLFIFTVDQVCAVDLRKLLAHESAILWASSMKRKGPVTASPLMRADRLYMVTDTGEVSCLDATNGHLIWHRSLGGGTRVYASPVLVGNQLLVCDLRGRTHLLDLDNPSGPVITNALEAAIYASPAIVDGRLYIRTTDRLWCLGTADSP